MKAKDLINLLFKVEESKEIQESLFYKQYGVIDAFLSNYAQNVINNRLKEQLKELHEIALEMQEFNPRESKGIMYAINKISTYNNLK